MDIIHSAVLVHCLEWTCTQLAVTHRFDDTIKCEYHLHIWTTFLAEAHDRFRDYCRSSGMDSQYSTVQPALYLCTPERYMPPQSNSHRQQYACRVVFQEFIEEEQSCITDYSSPNEGNEYPEWEWNATRKDCGKHAAIHFIHHPWLVWNPLLSTGDRLTQWGAPGIRFHPYTGLFTPGPQGGNNWDFLSRSYVRSTLIWDHFDESSGRIANHEHEKPPATRRHLEGGQTEFWKLVIEAIVRGSYKAQYV